MELTMQITITMNDEITWASRDVDFTLKLADIPADALAALVAKAAEMGFRKAGVDAAAGALKLAQDIAKSEKVDWSGLSADDKAERMEAATTELTEKKIQVWLGGTWGAERSGDGLSRIERMAISANRDAIKARDAQAYKAMDEKERFAACAEYFEGLGEAQKASLIKWATDAVALADKVKASKQAMLSTISVEV
jgi:hypothetical protein